jgi:hypothetical protein
MLYRSLAFAREITGARSINECYRLLTAVTKVRSNEALAGVKLEHGNWAPIQPAICALDHLAWTLNDGSRSYSDSWRGVRLLRVLDNQNTTAAPRSLESAEPRQADCLQRNRRACHSLCKVTTGYWCDVLPLWSGALSGNGEHNLLPSRFEDSGRSLHPRQFFAPVCILRQRLFHIPCSSLHSVGRECCVALVFETSGCPFLRTTDSRSSVGVTSHLHSKCLPRLGIASRASIVEIATCVPGQLGIWGLQASTGALATPTVPNIRR